MPIRKTGAAADQVVCGEQAQMTREAALGTPWGPEDDKALARENEAADQGDG